MSEADIEKAVSVAKHNRFKFAEKVETEQVLEMQRLKVRELEARAAISKSGDATEHSETNETLPTMFYEDKKYTQARGDRVQRYSADGKFLLSTYAGHTDACRDPTLDDPTPPGIKNAVKTRTVYKSFRWAALARHLPEDHLQVIGETVASLTIQKGFVAMLNLAKNRIDNVFCDQKAASEDRQFKNGAAICKAVKQGTQSGGHYFRMWRDCSKELQEDYLCRASLPNKRAPKGSHSIQKLHPITKQVIDKYSCIADVQRDMQISRQRLTDAIQHQVVVKGFQWKFETAEAYTLKSVSSIDSSSENPTHT